MKDKYNTVIIGAGLTGLSTAYHLKDDYLLIEGEKKCGGMFNSIEHEGYIFDLGERFVRIEDDKRKYFNGIFGKDFFLKQKLYSQIYLDDKRFWYPFQYNLYGLGKDKLDFCLREADRAHKKAREKRAKNFYDWMITNYGKGIAKYFMIPYNSKIWCTPPSRMSCDWFFGDKVVPKGDLNKIIKGAKKSFNERKGEKLFQDRFYPKRHGASSAPKFIEKKLSNPILYNSKVIKIDTKLKKIFTNKGDEFKYENLVSTMPLKELANIIRPVSERLKKWSTQLEYNSVLCMFLGVKGKMWEKNHWMYFPEKKYRFSRLYFQHNFSDKVAPNNRSIIGAIITYKGKSPLKKILKKELVSQLLDMGILKSKKDIDFIGFKNLKYGFCIPLKNTAAVSAKMRKELEKYNIYSIGRYGEWKYSGMEHALEDGAKITSLLKRAGKS